MPKLNWQYRYADHPANENVEGTYLMREIYIPFRVAQYVPVRCVDVVPSNYVLVRV